MNFEQARGAMRDAQDYGALFRAMKTAKAPAHWPRYTPEQQKEPCELPVTRSNELAEQMRKEVAKWEKTIKDAVRRMANPNISYL